MAVPSLAVVNFTTTLHTDEVNEAIHAVNRQITEHFAPIWGIARTLERLVPNFLPEDPDTLAEETVSADSVLYLVDESSLPGALGFHALNTKDVPFGFVFVLNPNDWTTTLSHEALELLLDPTVNVFVPGPDPRDNRNLVLHTYEACDAVERLSYQIGTVQVSDFVTPSYFTAGEIVGRQNDFLGVSVRSFGVTRGSHIAFINLATGQFETVVGQEAPARRRFAARLEAHDHPKPERSEASIQEILRNCQSNPPDPRATGLSRMRGVTRTARYAVSAQHARGSRR